VEVSRAKALRIAWHSKGEPPCPHDRLDAESTESGYFTGRYVCKECGDYVQIHNHAARRDPHVMKRPPWGRYVFYTSLGLLAAAVPVLSVWYKRSRHERESR
jgi:hypothetical protein